MTKRAALHLSHRLAAAALDQFAKNWDGRTGLRQPAPPIEVRQIRAAIEIQAAYHRARSGDEVSR